MRSFEKYVKYLAFWVVDLPPVALFLGRRAVHRLRARRGMSDEEYVRNYLRTLGDRQPTPVSIAWFVDLLRRGDTDRLQMLLSFVRLPPFLQERIFGATGNERHHAARLLLVGQHLPPAAIVLDLGGAADHPEGALMEMGYPHTPDSLTIVDLPAEARHHGARAHTTEREFTAASGTRVRYKYSSMTELNDVPDESVDLIWSGQSIEHIPQADAVKLCRQVRRILTPSGRWCLDTPNRLITGLLVPRGMIHPEHFIEYTPSGLTQVVESCGLEVRRSRGITPMPVSRRAGRINQIEWNHRAEVSDATDDSFSFFLEIGRPAT